MTEIDRQMQEAGYKMQARLFLASAGWSPTKLALPSKAEWIGINLLIRDDELQHAMGDGSGPTRILSPQDQ